MRSFSRRKPKNNGGDGECLHQLGILPLLLTSLLFVTCMIQFYLVTKLSSLTTTTHNNQQQLLLQVDTNHPHDPITRHGTNTQQQKQQPQQQPLAQGQEDHHLPKRHWAYVFLLAGVDPAKPSYRGFLYNILVAVHNLRQSPPVSSSFFVNDPSVRNTNTTSRTTTSTDIDVIVMVQMDKISTSTTLPVLEEELLQTMNIYIEYLPKPKTKKSNFYQVQYEKFRILNMTQYSRIMYLDADIMPLCNLQYLFELSEPSSSQRYGKDSDQHHHQQQLPSLSFHLQENVIVTWWNEPASGGLFILTPGIGKYEKILKLIAEQEIRTAERGDFDEIVGWGHIMNHDKTGDTWSTTPSWPAVTTTNLGIDVDGKEEEIVLDELRGVTEGTLWKWPGVYCDQGLLYYWTKYHEQTVSILNVDRIEQWTAGGDGDGDDDGGPQLEYVYTKGDLELDQLQRRSCLPPGMDESGQYGSSLHPMFRNQVPYRDFVHFTFNLKPWMTKKKVLPAALNHHDSINHNMEQAQRQQQQLSIKSSIDYWYYVLLHQLNDKIHLTAQDLDDLSLLTPPLGQYPKLTDMIRAGRQRQREN